MKKIALDLDGVVFDSETLYRVYTEIYDVDIFKVNSLVDNTKRIYQKRYHWSQEHFDKFYRENAKEILSTAPMMTGAEIVLSKLKDEFEFIVVTSRNSEEVKYAKEAFDKLGLSDIKIFDSEHNKINRLMEEQVDYVIDDAEETCIEASKNNICALYFKNSAQERLAENEYLKNVNNWGEIYKYLKLEG